MIDKLLKQKIEERAFEIYEWRIANGISGCETGDWLEAEAELADKRQTDGKHCPKCGFMEAGKDNMLICLNNSCDWQIEAKRFSDKNIPTFNEIKKVWE